VTPRTPGEDAAIDQKLAGTIGELLRIANGFNTGPMSAAVETFAYKILLSKTTRKALCESVALLALTILRKHPEKITAPPGTPTLNGASDGIQQRLTADLGDVANSLAAQATLYSRAFGAIAAYMRPDAEATPEDRLHHIGAVLDAVERIEEEAARDHKP
jgi:hypothetical protein